MDGDSAGREGRRELSGRIVRGTAWMLGSQAVTQVVGLVTSIVVARALGPRAVGLAGMALVFGSLTLVIMDFGFASALVQKPDLTDEDASSAFWAGLALGFTLTLLGVAISWPISTLYGEPEVQKLFAVLSLSFLFTAPGVVQGALLTRKLQFRALEVRTVVAVGVSSAVAIGSALAGAGPWAIVAQSLAVTSVSTILLWRSSEWRPKFIVSTRSLRTITRFSRSVFGARTAAWGSENADNLLVGGALGARSLGAYSIAYNVIVTPAKRISVPVAQVFFPAFSRMRDPDQIARTWLRALRMVALVVVPVLLGVLAIAPDFIALVFGAKWYMAAPILRILCLVGLAQALTSLNFGILQAVGQPQILFRWTAVASVLTIAAFAAGLRWGLTGVATAYLIVEMGLEPLFVGLTCRAVGTDWRNWRHSVAGILQAGVGMFAAVYGIRLGLIALSVGLPVRFGLCLLGGALTYGPLVLWRAPAVKHELRVLYRRRGEPGPVAHPVALDDGISDGRGAERVAEPPYRDSHH